MSNPTGAHRSRFSFSTRRPLDRLLVRLAETCSTAPRTVLAVALLTVVGALWLTITRLEFLGSRDDIATATSIPHTARYLAYTREFPDDGDFIAVVVDGRDPAHAEAFADALAGRLARRAGVRQVFYRIDPADFGGRALLYLPTGALRRLREALEAGRDLLAEVADRPGLVTLAEAVNRDVTRRLGESAADDLLGPDPATSGRLEEGGLDAGAVATLARALTRVVEGGRLPSLADAGLEGPSGGRAEAPGGHASLGRPRYLWSDDGRFLFLLVTPATAAADAAPRRFFDRGEAAAAGRGDPVAAVRAAVAETRGAFPGLEVGVTGPEALDADERVSTQRDVALAVLLGIAGNVLVLAAFARTPLRAACVLLCLGAALAWSFGFVTLAIGHLNILSAVFASILIGVGINFPIHLLARYEEAEREGNGPATALHLMLVRTGTTVAASTLVLVVAALATTGADLRAIAELGVISAAGLALSLLAAYTVFPSLLVLVGHRRGRPRASSPAETAARRLAAWLGRARWALAGGGALAVAGAVFALWRPPAFDSNLLDLQARESESVRWERALVDAGGGGTSFVLTDAADLAEARAKTAAFAALPLVARVESVLDLLPEDQPAKARILRGIRPLLAGLEVRSEAAAPFALEDFRRAVSRTAFKLGAAPGDETARARKALVALLAAIERAGPSAAGERLETAQAALVEEFARGLAFLKANLEPSPLTLDAVPADLRGRFVGRTGRLLMRIYPVENTWERAAMARFLADVRAVDPGVTGPRVQGFEVTETMRRDYLRAALLALGLITLCALVTFRNVADGLLATLPLAAGGLWTAGVMVVLGLDFNLANLFAVPLVIGLAVDSGMNLVGRAREEPGEASAILARSVGKSVLLAQLTTITSFGALMAAEHRGISSLGLLLTLGTTLTSAAAFLMLPPALAAVARRRAALRARGIAAAAALVLAAALAAGALVPRAAGAAAHAAPGAAAAPATGATEAVRGTIDAARAITRDPALAPAAREKRTRQLIAERFDTRAMARAALGPSADRLKPAEWQEYAELFTVLFTRSYSRMVLSFLEGVEVRYSDAEPAGQEAVVRTTLLKSHGETLPVDYHLRPRGDGWIFTDVVIDGLSLVASYRSQLERVMRTGGSAMLLERMRTRRDREP